MLSSVKNFICGAHIAPAHDGKSSVDVDAETGDVVLCDGLAGVSRFHFDSVTYHPFHTMAYESVLARRVAENFGGGCPYACDTPPCATHGVFIHGSLRIHSVDLFHALVLSAVGHALDVLAETSVGDVQLHYSMFRLYSWGVTDTLNQQVVAHRHVGVYTHDTDECCRPQLQQNVVKSREDAALDALLRRACAVSEGHSSIIFSLVAKSANASVSGVLTIALLPQLSQGNRFFQGGMQLLRELIAGHPVPHDRPCWLLQHLFPSKEIRSLAMITCITDDRRFYQENHYNCMYGCCPLVNGSGSGGCFRVCEGSFNILNFRSSLPQFQPSGYRHPVKSIILPGTGLVESCEKKRGRISRSTSAIPVTVGDVGATQLPSSSSAETDAAKRLEAELEERTNDLQDHVASVVKGEVAARQVVSELVSQADTVRSEIVSGERYLVELEGRVRDAKSREEELQQHVKSLEVEVEDLSEAKLIVESMMRALMQEFESAVVSAESAEDTMLRHVDRAEEVLRLSEADAASREAAAMERIHGMIDSYHLMTPDDVFPLSYESVVSVVADLFDQFVRMKLELLLESLKLWVCRMRAEFRMDAL
ncbi:hypothetical protein TcYC6_0103890 [Trypanosoma cruzi]|nr:hypothetical protein TcYC6_0103890 [Trypanosoma cruzi]